MKQEFAVLENKSIGRNLYTFRKIRDKKASEIADYLGIGEAAYTKYERGESRITIDVIQKVSECLQVDPLQIISATSAHMAGDNKNDIHEGTVQWYNEKQTALITKLIETQIAMNERIMTLLEKK
jgi:transcriptional regulator with XRE-family HTH domain